MAPECQDSNTDSCCTSCAKQYNALHETFSKKKTEKNILQAYNAIKLSLTILPDTTRAARIVRNRVGEGQEAIISLQLLAEFFKMYRNGHYGTNDEADSLLLTFVMEQTVMQGMCT
jgi:hypothetical protein